MQLYLQSSVVERGLGPDQLNQERAEVVTGSIFANVVAGFIIIATAATLYLHGDDRPVQPPRRPRRWRRSPAGSPRCCSQSGCSARASSPAAVLPVTAAYVISETFGFERGVSRSPREAPVFVGVVTALVIIGAVVAMIPGIPVFSLLVGVQVVNGLLLPVTLFFVWRLSASSEVMGGHRNGRIFNVLAGATVVVTSGLSLALLVVTILGL